MKQANAANHIASSSSTSAPSFLDSCHNSLAWAATVTTDGILLPDYRFAPTTPQDLQAPLLWNQEAGQQGIRCKLVCEVDSHVLHPQAPLLAPLLAGSEEEALAANVARDLASGSTIDAVPCPSLLDLVQATPHLDWLILTDTTGNVSKFAPETGFPRNLWLGTRVTCQEDADERLLHLLEAPAAMRFLLCDPLLEPIDLRAVQYDMTVEIDALTGRCGVKRPLQGRENTRLNWVIVGGAEEGVLDEQGQQHKCHLDDIRFLVQQCQSANCPVFVSQLGADVYWNQCPSDQHWLMTMKDKSGANIHEWPQDLRIRQFPAFTMTQGSSTTGDRHAN